MGSTQSQLETRKENPLEEVLSGTWSHRQGCFSTKQYPDWVPEGTRTKERVSGSRRVMGQRALRHERRASQAEHLRSKRGGARAQGVRRL